MIGKNTIKLVTSLSQKKFRTKENLFVVEGDKMVNEVLKSGIAIRHLYITSEFKNSNFETKNVKHTNLVEYKDLKKISLLTTPQNTVALCEIPEVEELPEELDDELSVYLDGIQDPGNMGTIVRICDWFGIENIFCSKDTVDFYHPKVIQASMGSFLRVKYREIDFKDLTELAEKWGSTIYGTFMDGENVYTSQLSSPAILVMGNEGNGIRKEVEKHIDRRISIPNFSTQSDKAESLNVSVATAILCSEFRRQF